MLAVPMQTFTMASSTEPALELPPELIHEILYHLDGDTESLRNFSLTSTAWTSFCRKILFNHVDLNLRHLIPMWIQRICPLSPPRTFIKECKLLEKNLDILLGALHRTPSLCSCVHRLTLLILNYSDPDHSMRGGVARRLIQLIRLLTSLTSVEITLGYWNGYADAMKNTYLKVLKTPSLVSVMICDGSMRYSTDILPFVECTKRVLEFRITNLISNNPGARNTVQRHANVPPPYSVSNLRILQLHSPTAINQEIYCWLLRSHCRISLQKLSLKDSMLPEGIQAVQALLNVSGQTLRCLEMTVPSILEPCKLEA